MTAAQVVEHEENPESSSRKRAQTNKEATRAPKREGKRSLKSILDMPPEVFSEVATHLMPGDLLSLARSNKLFRKMFMSRSSRHLWQTAFNHMPDIPPCPSDLCEPHYASLLFSKTCSKCGASVQRQMDPFLHVRLCDSCRNEDLVSISWSGSTFQLVPRSIVRKRGQQTVFTLRSEMEVIEHAEQDQDKYPEWCKARLVEVKERYERDKLLEDYLIKTERDRELKLERLKEQRTAEIEARLLQKGWTKQDMLSPSLENYEEWNKLTQEPEPITDHIWADLYPKLILLLKSNKAYNERVDKEARKLDRIKRLKELITQVKETLPPLVHVTLKRPACSDNKSGRSKFASTGLSGLGNYNVDVKVDAPFPWMAELLAWPIIERIVENDTSPEDAETGFIETREEFDAAVVDWRTKVEQDLVDIWGAGRTEDDRTEAKSGSSTSNGKGKGKAAARTGAGRNTRKTKERVPAVELSASETSRDPIELVLPEFTVTFTKPDGTTATNLSDLSPNLQILLRADTMFKAGPHHSYPGVVSPGGQPRRITRASGEELCGKRYRWNAEEVKHDDEASTLAKVLLAKVGRSGATTAEMQALRARFRCGRCTQTLPETWESLVFHYHKEQTNWKQARDKIHENPQSNFVYHNIHDLELGSSKPFAHFMTPEATINFALHVMTCMPCERMDIQAKHLHWFYSYAETPMVHHLLHVHDIARPICGTHYERRAYFANRFDDEDTDEDEFWV